ncbi:Outer membrane lipoprotein SlyB [Burkholderia cenocepacia]|uniref:glycine zipper 2TM domain-containing protein n=1 Tax=Burkholderia cenocepacia TaxID=95486 RepID=UPI00192C8325|nr:glycine zipper 2TM domain-containing protein [Burkholderia cenocepacia]CAD9228056.1 Outer membrane lipoprotein SlyB [Burkholderia cenocepacia]
MKKVILTKAVLGLVVASTLGLTGCAGLVPTNNQYTANQANSIVHVSYGTIIGMREVQMKEKTSGVGTAAGAIAGGALGSQVGGGRGSILGAVAGVLGGGVIGQAIERNFSNSKATEFILRMEDTGSTISITEKTDEKFAVGQRVQLIGTDKNNARIAAIQ